MRISARNYRIIEAADIEVSGLTIIRGQNDNGKSCLMRGLRTLVQNSSGDSQIRYGAPEFAFRVDLPANDHRPARSAEMHRARKGSPVLYIDDGPAIEKLGRNSLCEIDPSFPLKVIPFADDKFLPNFVFQKQVPVFGQADIYAFFASMFEPVAQVSRHLLKVRKRSSDASSETARAKAQLESYNQLLVDYQLHLDEFDVPLVMQEHAIIEDNRAQVAEYNRMYAEHQKIQQALEALVPYEPLLEADLDGLQAQVSAIQGLQQALETRDDARDALVRTNAVVIQCERVAGILEGLPATAVTDLQAAYDALAVYNQATSKDSSLAVALDRITAVEATMGDVSQSTFNDFSQASDVLMRYRHAEDKVEGLRTRIRAVETMEPLLHAAEAHKAVLQARLGIASLEAKMAESDAVIHQCFHELKDVVSCPVCGHDLEGSMLNILGERP